MLKNTQFAMAVHIMTALAYNPSRVLPSTSLAKTVGSNPSFLRSLIGRLAAAGLVETKLGKGGGTSLNRAPAKITLLDIYRATSGPEVVAQHRCKSRMDCAVAEAMPTILGEIDSQLQRVVETELARTKLSTLLARHVSAQPYG